MLLLLALCFPRLRTFFHFHLLSICFSGKWRDLRAFRNNFLTHLSFILRKRIRTNIVRHMKPTNLYAFRDNWSFCSVADKQSCLDREKLLQTKNHLCGSFKSIRAFYSPTCLFPWFLHFFVNYSYLPRQ